MLPTTKNYENCAHLPALLAALPPPRPQGPRSPPQTLSSRASNDNALPMIVSYTMSLSRTSCRTCADLANSPRLYSYLVLLGLWGVSNLTLRRYLERAKTNTAAPRVPINHLTRAAVRVASNAPHVYRGAVLPTTPAATGFATRPLTRTAIGFAIWPFTRTAIVFTIRLLTRTAIGFAVRPLTRTAIGFAIWPFTRTAIGFAVRPLTRTAIGFAI